MVIRESQMEVMSDSMMRGFEQRMLANLRSRFTSKLAKTSDADIVKLIRKGVDDSRVYGVVAESDVRRYLEYMVEYSPDFDRNPNTPWAQRILTTPGALGWKKMNDLDAFTTFELRQ